RDRLRLPGLDEDLHVRRRDGARRRVCGAGGRRRGVYPVCEGAEEVAPAQANRRLQRLYALKPLLRWFTDMRAIASKSGSRATSRPSPRGAELVVTGL